MADREQPQERRRDAFVAAARDAFFAHGYGATAMSAVAATVGGSKTTLWSYFPSKATLFAAVIDDIVDRYGQSLETPIDPALPVVEALRGHGRAMMAIIMTPSIIDMHRLVFGEAGRFPELGTIMYERGARRGLAKLSDYCMAAMADGRMRRGDPALAARHFAAMCQSDLHQKRMLGLIGPPDQAAIDASIEATIESFLAGWLPDQSRAT